MQMTRLARCECTKATPPGRCFSSSPFVSPELASLSMYVYVDVYIYIYIYIERERDVYIYIYI